MGIRPVLGASPISFVDPKTGQQYSIPLPVLEYAHGQGAPDPSSWPSYAGLSADAQAALTAWIGELVRGALIAPGEEVPPPPAFKVSAVDPGSTGDGIVLSITKVTPNLTKPGLTSVDASIATSQVYKALTPDTLIAVIGKKGGAAGSASRPGLVVVDGTVDGVPVAADADLGATAKLDVGKDGGAVGDKSFSLVPRKSGDEGKAIHVVVANIDKVAKTFDLTVTWSGAKATSQVAKLKDAFPYLITVTPPDGGFAHPPALGDVTLSGGADGDTPAPSAAIVLSA